MPESNVYKWNRSEGQATKGSHLIPVTRLLTRLSQTTSSDNHYFYGSTFLRSGGWLARMSKPPLKRPVFFCP
jgi:hypothetical protein